MSQLTKAISNSGPGGYIQTLTSNSGGPVPPTAGNINVIGGVGITGTGNPGTSTITLDLNASVATQYNEDIGSAVPAANILHITGGNNILTSGAGSTVTIDLDGTTNHAIQIGNALGSLTSLGVAGNGQLPIGSVGADPVIANLTAGTGVTISNGPGSISIAASGSVATTYTEDVGSATPAANNLNILGTSAQGISTSGAGSTVTITAATSTTTQKGVVQLATNAQAIAGTDANNAVTAAALAAKLGTQTAHSLLVAEGTASAFTALGVATNGQLPIGSTGADPILANLTAGAGITITNGAGSITIAATGADILAYTNVNTTPYVVLSTDEYLSVDCSGGPITLQFPNAATTGRVFYVKDRTGSANTNNITLTTVGGAVNIDGATTYVMNTQYSSVNIIGNSTSYELF